MAAVASLLTAGCYIVEAADEEVTYDGRSLIIGGQRKILFSGSIHYPRSTPQVTPITDIIESITKTAM